MPVPPREGSGQVKLAYHKLAQQHLAQDPQNRTLFVFIGPATDANWRMLKQRTKKFPYVAALPKEDGCLPDFDRVTLPQGAQECLIIDTFDLPMQDIQKLAFAASRVGMVPTCVVQASGYTRIGSRT